MPHHNPRILIVDDEINICRSCTKVLTKLNYEVDYALNGYDALKMMDSEPFDIVITDLKMSSLGGMEVLRRVKDVYPDTLVIVMTGYASVSSAVEVRKIGALDYFIKPFDPETLIPMVERLYQEMAAAEGRQIEVGAVVLCGGTAFFDPTSGKNTYGYGKYPNVVTHLEFERNLSGTGPYQGRLVRPSDGKPLRKIAWIQCVGSRDLQVDAD